ncbi:hypothetical protein [Streptomyces sp. NPDC088752]|uniref:hypothetical protein n=1 Tax=Streptomyces sp. NPDC088752 TaxID=3154963 RepID=UPI0034340C9B
MKERYEPDSPAPGALCLTQEDRAVYQALIAPEADIEADDPRLAHLRELGVVFTEPLTQKPGTRSLLQVERAYTADKLSRALQLITEALQVAPAMDALASVRDSADPTSGPPDVEVLRDMEKTNATIFQAIETASYVWSSQTAPRPIRNLSRALERDLALLRAGKTYRNLYPTSARTREMETEYSRITAETGNSETRTSSRNYARMIITDTLGVISDVRVGEGGTEPAMIIRHPALLAWLKAMFEREWTAADPWFPDAAAETPVSAIERGIMTLLSTGHKRDTICRRLEISTRSYSTYLANLRERYDVKTTEQLMYEYAKRNC